MKTRIIHTKIWTDSYFTTLSETEKLLFFYFITNEYVNIIHLYECPNRLITFNTGIKEEDIQPAKNKFQADKKFYFYKDFIYIANASRYEEYLGEKNQLAKTKTYLQLPKDVLQWFYSLTDTPMDTPINNLMPISIKKKTGSKSWENVGKLLHAQKQATV